MPHDCKTTTQGAPARPGALFAFEGIDGTGKSTQARLLAEYLQDAGLDVTLTREPTDGPYGRKLRELFTARHTVSREEELALFLADRREHVRELLAPALAAGRVVITDRYFLSTVAYQGAAGLDAAAILAENEAFAPIPDRIFLLTAPPATGLYRVKALRGDQPNDFEGEQYLARVAAVFDGIARDYVQRVDAGRELAAIQEEIRAVALALLAQKGLYM